MKFKGENDHHKVEGLFKSFARTLKQAMSKTDPQLQVPKDVCDYKIPAGTIFILYRWPLISLGKKSQLTSDPKAIAQASH